MMKSYLYVALIAMTPCAALAEESKATTVADLDFLIGVWSGRSTFLYPREDGRAPAHEEAQATCAYILNETYIQCDTAWARPDGRRRAFRLHFNTLEDGYQTLFLYDNWPRHVSYVLRYDSGNGVYIGGGSFVDSNGVAGEERVEWRFSADGTEVRSEEFNHLEGDPGDYWPKYFEFVWRKAE